MELSILLAIQSVANLFLDYLAIGVTMLGEPVAAVLAITVVYWLLDKETGEYMTFSLLLSVNANGLVKNICNFPRPIGQEGVRSLRVETATGASFPSGHTQTAAALFGSIAIRARRAGTAFAAALVVVLVALSRLYLGVHWPKDVLVGAVLGLLCAVLVYLLFSNFNERGRERACLVLAAAFLPLVLLWHDADFVKGYGLLVGYAAAIPLEHRFVRFPPVRRTLRARLSRELFGLLVVAAVKLGLGFLLPDLLPLKAVEYGAVAFAAFYLCPLLFVKLRW